MQADHRCRPSVTSFAIISGGVVVMDSSLVRDILIHGEIHVSMRRRVGERVCFIKKNSENDGCGVRTHALSDWRLKPAP